MFHTFETTQYSSPGQVEAGGMAAKRRTSTVRACEPCRRRKIRCNGEHPCETCQWYRKAPSCHYTEPRQRQTPSKRSVEKVSQTLQEYRGILQKLFPHVHPDQLKELPREKLVELMSEYSPFHPPASPAPSTEERPPLINPEAGSLEQLQPMPEEGPDGNDVRRRHNTIKGITDDVNMLSLSVKQNPSYLGISSVMAVLRVITWLDPECLIKSPERTAVPSREVSIPPESGFMEHDTPRTETVSTVWDEIPLINAFFIYVHPFAPLIEEQSFRETYMAGQRADSRWLLLLNAVLAMGSMAAGSSGETDHHIYFARAKQHLNLDTLDSAHLETVQALAILSGLYLHYVQIPNQANALMGATLRIATMLGLHRDYSEGVGPNKVHKAAYSIEMRRRIWWSTFILDAWVGNTLGRPSMGRTSQAITAKPPQEAVGRSQIILTLTQENIRFCVISTRMEDALAVSPLLEENQRRALDGLYQQWYKHSSIQGDSPQPSAGEPPGIAVLKNVMRWRYLSSRVILHRPVLLWYAMRRIRWDQLSPEKQSAIELCREVCASLIDDIACTWRGEKACQMSGWNATWLLYQATMVPLLSLYSDALDFGVVHNSRNQIELAMQVMTDLQGWSTTAKRSLEVISRLFDASKRHSPNLSTLHETYMPSIQGTPASTTTPAPRSSTPASLWPTYLEVSCVNAFGDAQLVDTPSQELMMDNMFDSLRWSTSWDSPIGGPQLIEGWDYNSMNNWAGMSQADHYSDLTFVEDPNRMGFDMSMPASHPADLLDGHYEHLEYHRPL